MAYYQPVASAQNTQSTSAVETGSTQASLTLHQADIAQLLSKGELSVSISELLGCDYVFVIHPAKTLLMHERHITPTLNQLISVLGLTPGQKIFIGTHEDDAGDMRFYRFACEWQGSTATQVTRTAITDSEQIDFMRMIFDCSSPYEQEAL